MITTPCTFKGCGLRRVRLTFCKFHAEQLLSGKVLTPRKGQPGYAEWAERRRADADTERFWSRVEKSDGCWEWTGTKNDKGYGRIRQGGKSTPAHRMSYVLEHGEIPAGQLVDHACHNPSCVNPAHLRLATQRQNQENRAGANRNSKSGIRGVSPHEGKWLGVVRVGNIQHRAGLFDTTEEAAEAVRALRKRLMPHSILDQ